MGADLVMTPYIDIPKKAIPKVRALVKQYDLSYCLEVSDDGSLSVENYDAGYTDVERMTGEFFPELAKLLKGTRCDGQVVDINVEGGAGEWSCYAFCAGKVISVPEAEHLFIDDRWRKPGDTLSQQVWADTLVLPGGKALITGVTRAR